MHIFLLEYLDVIFRDITEIMSLDGSTLHDSSLMDCRLFKIGFSLPGGGRLDPVLPRPAVDVELVVAPPNAARSKPWPAFFCKCE